MIKLIIFDLWHTLAQPYNTPDTLHSTFEFFQPKLSREKLRKTFENSTQKKIWKSEFNMYKNFLKNIKVKATKEAVNVIMAIREYEKSKAMLYRHVMPMLKKLKKQGYKLALLSNSTCFDCEHLERDTKFIEYFDYPFFSFQHGMVKPNPKIFKQLLKKTKCKPEEAIMIGDNLIDDTIPARRLGLNSIHYKNYKQLKRAFKKFDVSI